MKRIAMVTLAAALVFSNSNVFAQDKFGHGGHGDPMDAVRRGTAEIQQTLARDVADLLRSAKHDFMQLKRVTQGNYQANEILTRFGDSMGALQGKLENLERNVLPRMMQALEQGQHGGGGQGGQGGHGMTCDQLVSVLTKSMQPSDKLAQLGRYVGYVDGFNGQGLINVFNLFLYASDKEAAADIIAKQGNVYISTEDLANIMAGVMQPSNKLAMAKKLIPFVSDLNPMSIERLRDCFLYTSDKDQMTQIAMQYMGGGHGHDHGHGHD